MKILHGTWIPHHDDSFVQSGAFALWIETDTNGKKNKNLSGDHAPTHLPAAELADFLINELGIKTSPYFKLTNYLSPKYFILPTADGQPLPSPELSRYLEDANELEAQTWQAWEIDCYLVPLALEPWSSNYPKVSTLIKFLNDLYFLTRYNLGDFQLGSDLLFWHYYLHLFSGIILKDQYIPALKYRESSLGKGDAEGTLRDRAKKQSKTQAKTAAFEIYPGWEILGESYADNLQQAVSFMPLACVAGLDYKPSELTFYDRETLLRHFSEVLLHSTLKHIALPATFEKKLGEDSLISRCLASDTDQSPATDVGTYKQYQQWQDWKTKLIGVQAESSFYLCFKLKEGSETSPNDWQIEFLVALKTDPSLKLALNDYWYRGDKRKKEIQQQFGSEFEKELILQLGYAARIYPAIWKGLETDKPTGFKLTLEESFTFLKETAWILEDSGYKVIVPAWWTPTGRQRAKLRLKASGKKSAPKSAGKGIFSLKNIIEYHYELSLGDQVISEKEWQQLVKAKSPLIKFRGQWVELDQEQMAKMLTFWQSQQQENPEMTLLELLQKASENPDTLEVETDATLAEMMAKLQNPSQMEPIENPEQLQGNLREYQKRGVAWIQFLENLGLNGCLADDMGLGKSIQVIARLIQEREQADLANSIAPTLLVAPTSVVGNWQKELEKFAPHLKSLIHHGSKRYQNEAEFKAACLEQDVIITSFTLVRKDAKLFNSLTWQRIVLDEAQNIKNPQAAQTKAILKLEANYRLALTGTPVENRLLDLWSIFNFLNPGYLGKEPQFRKIFEIPIQRQGDRVQSTTLKKLVEPFILRRVKTDKQIIKDLPDKVEHKQYCNLTKEQASLYEVVVKDVSKQLEEVEGIQRKGLMLSTLMKLKQICNHPRQFLQDNSDFTSERSHKLERLGEMLEEVLAEGESLLIFTQFTEIGEALNSFIKHRFHCNTFYLHGGTSRQKREKMITEFQDPETDPSAFVLSLKAGGVGITLTKANHVFHFDRWWNPAVEDQATDRAFRIGQQKNVFVHKFVTLGTLEEKIDQMIEEKKKMAGLIVGNDESWLTELDNDSFKELIALNKQTIV
jgi:SNF2 family DNA or RNA helicase